MLYPVPAEPQATHFAGVRMEQKAIALAAEEGITELQAYRQLQALQYIRRNGTR